MGFGVIRFESEGRFALLHGFIQFPFCRQSDAQIVVANREGWFQLECPLEVRDRLVARAGASTAAA